MSLFLSSLQLVYVVLQESVLHMRSVSTSTAEPPMSSPRPSASKTNCRRRLLSSARLSGVLSDLSLC